MSSTIANEIEIIVVDNDSKDGSFEMLAQDFPDVRCIANNKNIGFGKANNSGVKVAKGEYILVLNPDTMLTESTLSEMLYFSEKQNKFGAAGVQFVNGNGNYLPESKRNFPDLKVAGAKLLGHSKYYYANHIERNELAEIDVLTGAFMFIKKEVYNEIGGFDEDFFMYGEDIDLSYRISKAGYKNFYIGSSKVLHFKGESTVKDKFYLENFYGALSIFYKKHFPNKAGLYGIVDGLIRLMISVKSIAGIKKPKIRVPESAWVYLGEDKLMLDRLKALHPDSLCYSMQHLDIDLDTARTIFFDSKSLKFSQIIDKISMSSLRDSRKRIISQDHRFYLGSDTSNERGEVVEL